MIKNILFDMGNVLIRFEPKQYVKNAGLSESDQQLLLRELTAASTGCGSTAARSPKRKSSTGVFRVSASISAARSKSSSATGTGRSCPSRV